MSQILIYQSEDGRTKLDVHLEEQTVWLTQKQLTELFGKAKGTISEHIKHIFEDGELTYEATVRLFRTVQQEGGREVTRELERYNLDMVLALGFRVPSPVVRLATIFGPLRQFNLAHPLSERLPLFRAIARSRGTRWSGAKKWNYSSRYAESTSSVWER